MARVTHDWTEPQSSVPVPRYVPSPTVEEFIHGVAGGTVDEMRICILQGNRGCGKTLGGLMVIAAMATRLLQSGRRDVLPLRAALVRDTWANIKRTTVPSFDEARTLFGLPVEWREGQHEAVVLSANGQEIVHFYLFGMDSRQDADKFQGFACAILWLEEVAPAAELNAGIAPETFGIGITSVRQAKVARRVLVTMNPPDDDHWILTVESFMAAAGLEKFRVLRYDVPATEKADHFRRLAAAAERSGDRDTAGQWTEAASAFESYQAVNRAALESIGRHDLVHRLVEGRIGGLLLGEMVVPTWSEDHLEYKSFKELTEFERPPAGATIIRAWDGGQTPSTVWLYVNGAGNVDILASRTSVNKGMSRHILDEVLPWQREHGIVPAPLVSASPASYGRTAARRADMDEYGKPRVGGYRFRDIGDPALFYPGDAKGSEETARHIIEGALNTSVEPGPVPWQPRRLALENAFAREGTGRKRLIRVYADQGNPAEMLVKSLRGRAHYPVDRATNRIDFSVEAAKRASGVWFQALDSLGYALAVLFPPEDWLRQAKRPAPPVRPKPRDWLAR